MFMPKQPVSVTLDQDNLVWLRGRMVGQKSRSLSEALDDLITMARHSGQTAGEIRSVVATIDIAADDPLLERADRHVRAEFVASLAGRSLVGESPPAARRQRSHRVPRGKTPRRG
jgi:hypothetical protein